jgi:hypothetical protein
MKLLYISQKGESAIQCEHCNYGYLAFRPINEELLDLMNCPQCRVNSRGERDDFDTEAFRASQGEVVEAN